MSHDTVYAIYKLEKNGGKIDISSGGATYRHSIVARWFDVVLVGRY